MRTELTGHYQRVEHAGYHRCVLHYNPPRFDPDGDIVEPADEYEDEDELSQVEEDPYADIHLESKRITRTICTVQTLIISSSSACASNFRR